MVKVSWPAPERNKGPILGVLQRVLPTSGTVLEIASGTGQHAVHFARNLPQLHFLPTDPDSQNLESIRAWVREAALSNLALPQELDVCASEWGVGDVDAIFNANMLHITPWECASALFAGAARHLTRSGVLVLYGPYRLGGQHTAPSNAQFDADLRQRDPRFGVRDLEAVGELAEKSGFSLDERVEMPAKNQMLVWRHA